MSTFEYGIRCTKPNRNPVVCPMDSLAEAAQKQQDWSRDPKGDRSITYTVVSRTVTASDWTPVDPTEATS